MRAASRTAPPIDSVAACGYGLGGCGQCGLLLPVAPRHCLSPGPGAAPDAAGATDAANTHTAKSSAPRRFISVIGLSFRDAGFPPGPDPGRGRRLDESIIPGRQGRCKVRCGSQVGLRASQWSADYTPDEHRGGAISMELADLIRETAMVLINHFGIYIEIAFSSDIIFAPLTRAKPDYEKTLRTRNTRVSIGCAVACCSDRGCCDLSPVDSHTPWDKHSPDHSPHSLSVLSRCGETRTDSDGRCVARTRDLLLVRQVLSQLS
jgi:hypothetical protein